MTQGQASTGTTLDSPARLKARTDSTRAAVAAIERMRMAELHADVLRCQVDSLRDALVKVLDTRDKESKAWFALHNARENFSDRGVKEEKLHLDAMEAVSRAEKGARVLLATLTPQPTARAPLPTPAPTLGAVLISADPA